jgi:hypothetical protein
MDANLLLGIAGLVVGLLPFVYQLQQTRKERERADRAENELAENTRRAVGPLLRARQLLAGDDVVEGVFGEGEMKFPPKSTLMKLMVGNVGAAVNEVSDDWTEGTGLSCADARLEHADIAGVIEYRFNRSHFRFPMKLRLNFVGQNGAKLHQVYEVTHGICEIKRIDPK